MIDWSGSEYLVVVGCYDADVSWTNRLKFDHIIYYKDQPDKEPYNAINKGKGETNTLKFIADFYDVLPANLIQTHQYEHKSYLSRGLVDLLNDPLFITKYQESPTPGYWCFNDKFKLGPLGPQAARMVQSGWWHACMADVFGPIAGCGDFTNGKNGCAQFIVSRDRIRSLPRS